MPPATPPDLKEIASQFQLDGRYLSAGPVGSGHINDTYASRFKKGRGEVHYIHQWINHHIFRDPEKLMENVRRVTAHARDQICASGGDPQRETLNLIPAVDGRLFHRTPQGDYWRTYQFIEGARTYDRVEDLRHVHNAARAFGSFQKMVSGLPGGRLHETIPDFHHTPKRFEAFLTALENDACNRAREVRPEIDFILERKGQTSVVMDLLVKGEIPERVTHNDTKLNNVMIDDETGEGICVIDLDTVMPGSTLYDFGDMVRIGASSAAEDEKDLSKVKLDLTMFNHLAQGYLDSAREFLTATEIDHLAFSACLITLEQAIRFLGDYLNGDVYYKIHYPGHNLDRSRTQIKMVAEMEISSGQMETIINRYR